MFHVKVYLRAVYKIKLDKQETVTNMMKKKILIVKPLFQKTQF